MDATSFPLSFKPIPVTREKETLGSASEAQPYGEYPTSHAFVFVFFVSHVKGGRLLQAIQKCVFFPIPRAF